MRKRDIGEKAASRSVYVSVIERVFAMRHKTGSRQVEFSRTDIEEAAAKLRLDPKNIGDLVYSFRYRRPLPSSIKRQAPAGHVWIIRGIGTAKYRFDAIPQEEAFISPRIGQMEIRIPDATPGIIAKYSLTDEQALLARVRYNRLLDIFTGIACYSLQSHLRTQVDEIGQVETDEIYVGLDKEGAHYVLPVQAKGGKDRHSIVQIEQDVAMCKDKFPLATCRAIAAQMMKSAEDYHKIALIGFVVRDDGTAAITNERHYVLVPPEQVGEAELAEYRRAAARQA